MFVMWMRRRWLRHAGAVCGVLFSSVVLLLCGTVARACPFCAAPPQTWAEILDASEVVVIAELVDVQTFDLESRAVSRFRVQQLHDCPGGPQRAGMLRPGTVFAIPEYVEGQPGDIYLLTGQMRTGDLGPMATYSSEEDDADVMRTVSDIRVLTDDTAGSSLPLPFLSAEFVEWDFPEAMTPEAIHYVQNAPSNSLPQRLRLSYYIEFLEHADSTIATDAWGEFARSQYDDVKSVRRELPLADLRRWIADRNTFPERLGLYGMMLGLCGSDEDAEFLLQHIEPDEDAPFRFGTEGLIGGYLLLTGESGLDYLDRQHLQPAGTSLDSLVATVFAMRFVWSYEPELIARDELRLTLRRCLSHSDLREMIIPDLARWQAWGATFDLIDLYDSSTDHEGGLRRAIQEFMKHCAKEAGGETSLTAELFLAEVSAAPERETLRAGSTLVAPQ